MKIVYEPEFLKRLARIPKDIQSRADELLQYAKENPFHPLLHTKQLKPPLKGFYAFRVKEYRIEFSLDYETDIMRVLWIKHRKDAYK
jgi:mRNA-degrading endonuclease RelE of RelBE toxin-antitoxin system